jgi:hypothetical protein
LAAACWLGLVNKNENKEIVRLRHVLARYKSLYFIYFVLTGKDIIRRKPVSRHFFVTQLNAQTLMAGCGQRSETRLTAQDFLLFSLFYFSGQAV